jgi:hypothetical protein
VGIEKVQGVHRGRTLVLKRGPESLRILRALQVGIEQVQGVHRGQNCWKFWEKILYQVGIEWVCRQTQKRRELF